MRILWSSLLVVALVACKGKSEQSAPAAGSGSNAPSTPSVAALKNEPPIEIAGAPAECNAYKAAIDKLQACTGLDVTSRAKLRHAYNESATKWNAQNAPDKASLAQQCKDGLAAVEATAKTPCKW
jgi:hypothetical protein